MRVDEYVRATFLVLLRHKMRTLLTMLGIIFGVGAVISMLSIGAGAQAEAMQMIDSMGLRNIILRDKPVDEQDLAVADFGTADSDSKRLYASPTSDDVPTNRNAPDLTGRGRYETLERETGFEPATLGLGRRKRGKQ